MKAIQNWVVAASGLDPTAVVWSYQGGSDQRPFIELNFEDVRQIAHDWVEHFQSTLTFAPVNVTAVDTVGHTFTAPNHGLTNGDGAVQITSTGTIPAPLLALTDYWVIVVDANTLQIAATFENTGGKQPEGAANPKTPIAISSAGSGTIQIVDTPRSERPGQEMVTIAQGFREINLQMQCFGATKTGNVPMQILEDVVTSIPLHVYDLDQAGVGVDDLGTAFTQGNVRLIEGRRNDILEPRAVFELTCYVTASLTSFATYIASLDLAVRMTDPVIPEIDLTVRR